MTLFLKSFVRNCKIVHVLFCQLLLPKWRAPPAHSNYLDAICIEEIKIRESRIGIHIECYDKWGALKKYRITNSASRPLRSKRKENL